GALRQPQRDKMIVVLPRQAAVVRACTELRPHTRGFGLEVVRQHRDGQMLASIGIVRFGVHTESALRRTVSMRLRASRDQSQELCRTRKAGGREKTRESPMD